MPLAGTAHAQDYPARPVTMIMPFAAGGPQDTIGRLVGARMSEILGQQIVIENIGGAGGMTGSLRVKNAPPDGYTFVLGERRHARAEPDALQEARRTIRPRISPPSAFIGETPIALTRAQGSAGQ